MRINRKKLVLAMMDANLNTKQLAEKIKVSRVTVSSVKSGKSCSEDTAIRIAAGLGVPLEKLLEK